MDVFSGLTDDQMALIGCAAALAASGTVMALSYYLGRLRNRPEAEEPARVRSLPLTGSASHSNQRRPRSQPRRKAA